MEPSYQRRYNEGGESESEPCEIPEFMNGVRNIEAILEKGRSEPIQRKVSSILRWTRSGFPGQVPVPLTRDNLHLLADEDYVVKFKVDGTRYLMLIEDENKIYFIDRNNQVFQVKGLVPFPKSRTEQRLSESTNQDLDKDETFTFAHLRDTLVDGEMVEINPSPNGCDMGPDTINKFMFLIFDVLQVDGVYVGDRTYGERLQFAQAGIIEPRRRCAIKNEWNICDDSFDLQSLTYWKIKDTKHYYKKGFMNGQVKCDGLIFQNANDAYDTYPDPNYPGRSDKNLKWKPSKVNTLDFRLEFPSQNCIEGDLFVANSNHSYGKIELTDELRKLNGKIIECLVSSVSVNGNSQNYHYQFYRYRWDKKMPNDVHTARTTLQSIEHPITEEYLYNFIDGIPN